MFWNSVVDNTVDLSDLHWYDQFDNLKITTIEGYRCDPLAPSHTVFLGSCDMNGPITNGHDVWSKQLYNKLDKTKPFPYIALSKIHTAFDSMNRRLLAYCETYGAPERIFVVLPRPVCVEIPLGGKLVNISEREKFIHFLSRNGKITEAEGRVAAKSADYLRAQLDNPDHQLYHFEKCAAMLKLICKAYNIELLWTPNLAASAVIYYGRWLELFLKDNEFMRNTCVGVTKLEELTLDGAAGDKAQTAFAEKLLNNQRYSLEQMVAQTQENLKWLITNRHDIYEKLETDSHR